MKKSQKVLQLEDDLKDIHEDLEEIKRYLAMPDNNFAVINTMICVAQNKLGYIVEEIQPKKKEPKFQCPEFNESIKKGIEYRQAGLSHFNAPPTEVALPPFLDAEGTQ